MTIVASVLFAFCLFGGSQCAPVPGDLEASITDLTKKYPSISGLELIQNKPPNLIPVASEFAAPHYGTNRLSDLGPTDLGHEMHAKMEEAVEHALAIINGAAKFAEEAQLEQESLPGKSQPETKYK